MIVTFDGDKVPLEIVLLLISHCRIELDGDRWSPVNFSEGMKISIDLRT